MKKFNKKWKAQLWVRFRKVINWARSFFVDFTCNSYCIETVIKVRLNVSRDAQPPAEYWVHEQAYTKQQEKQFIDLMAAEIGKEIERAKMNEQ